MAGVAKGAGMMNPLFATMLAFVFTDYPIDKKYTQAHAPGPGQAELRAHKRRRRYKHQRYRSGFLDWRRHGCSGRRYSRTVKAAIGRVMKALALLVVKDGEGATKRLIHLTVKGAAGTSIAERIAPEGLPSPPS